MNVSLRAVLLGTACALGIAGCGITEVLTESGRIDYKSSTKAPAAPSLEIPPDLANPRADERYAIPERAFELDPDAPGAAGLALLMILRPLAPSATAGSLMVAPASSGNRTRKPSTRR